MNALLAQLLSHGLVAVFAASLIESLGAPVPALPVILLTGSLAAQHGLSVWPLVLGSAGGFWIGDVVWYAFGWTQGRRVLGLLCGLSLNPDACVGRGGAPVPPPSVDHGGGREVRPRSSSRASA